MAAAERFWLRPALRGKKTACDRCYNPAPSGERLIILGIILLIIGLVVASIHFLIVVGVVLLVIGLGLALMGVLGRAVGGRRHYY
jgi:hypothetical protein